MCAQRFVHKNVKLQHRCVLCLFEEKMSWQKQANFNKHLKEKKRKRPSCRWNFCKGDAQKCAEVFILLACTDGQ